MQIAASLSLSAAPPLGAPPVPGPVALTPPSILTPVIAGAEAELDEGVWSGAGPITLTLQWLRDGVALSGQTAATLPGGEVLAGAVLTCVVTATDAAGSRVRVTAPVTVLSAAPIWDAAGGERSLTITAAPDTAAPEATGGENQLTVTR